MPDIKALYHPIIMAYAKKEENYRKDEEADIIVEAVNPFCGDSYTLYLRIEKNLISSASFHGYGCAVSRASTCYLTNILLGQKSTSALKIIQIFLSFMQQEKTKKTNLDGLDGLDGLDNEVIEALSVVWDFPEREECVQLSWKAVEKEFMKKAQYETNL